MKRTPIKWPAADPNEKVYWRSLDQLAETSEFREFLNREFQEGAAELNSPLSRRSFMSLMGASLALAGLSGCRRPEEHILPYTRAPEDLVMGLPTYYATALPIGSAVYGVLVESNEGRPTKIEGNPLHPMSLGATNSYVQASILDLYDPDRSTAPMLKGRDHDELAAPVPAHSEHGAEEHGEEADGHAAVAPKLRTFDSTDAMNFLRGPRDKAASQKGKGLYVLSGALTSPTVLRLREQLKVELPEAKWATWEPSCEDNVRAGSRLAFGEDLVSHYDFQKADVVLALDSDFLYGPADAVRSARGFAARRKAETVDARMNRLYVVESAWTVTGTNADHRLRVRPSEITGLVAALAAKLASLGVQLPSSAPGIIEALPKGGAVNEKFVSALAEDLKKAGSHALITVGPNQPAEVHALVHALHTALAAETVSYTKAMDAGRALDLESLKALAAALDKGEVETLVVLGGNPVYDAPADLKLGEKLAKTVVVHLGLYRDETAKLAALHIPRTHTLEAWGDVRSADGTASIIQPLIAPLYKGCSDIELVSYLLTGKMTRGYELVRDTWRGVAVARMPAPPPAPVVPVVSGKAAKGAAALKSPQATALGILAVIGGTAKAAPAASPASAVAVVPPTAGAPAAAAPPPGIPNAPILFFERFWRKSLHDGVIEGTAFEAVKPALKPELAQAMAKLAAVKPRPMEVQFLIDNTVLDGRFANSGWLQELPDPVTKMVWDNAAILSMDTAKQLGVEKDDMVRITVRGQQMDAAVYVQPGQASNTVSIALGYGRKEVGRIGKGAGFDAYPLRHTDALGFDAAEVAKLNSKYTDPRDEWFGDIVKLTGLVTTQDHFALEGRPLVREASLTRFKQKPDFAKHKVHLPPLLALWDDDKQPGQQWGMTIDLSACVGCGACTTACQAENNISIVGKPQVRKGREMHWIRIDRYFSFQSQDDLTDDNTDVTHQPVNCMQCENAPCENVCPVAATMHSPDGLNDMVYNRCVGTRYCANNCPWKVRRFNFLDWRGDVEEVQKLMYNPDVTLRSRGVMEKCTYCVQRIRGAQRDAKMKTGSDRLADQQVVTACQQACPAEAITFGDITDPSSKVSVAKKSPRTYEMLAELNTRPRTSYLARIRNPNPALYSEPAEADEEEHGPAAAAHGAGPEHTAPQEPKAHEAGASHP